MLRSTSYGNSRGFNFCKIEHTCLKETGTLPLLSNTMATFTKTPLTDALCADPAGGHIFRYLLNGGSWYEADQMHWRLVRDHALAQLDPLLGKKPTGAHVARAKELLALLHECARQLVADSDSAFVAKKAETLVQAWSKPKASVNTTNAFNALVEDSEEE